MSTAPTETYYPGLEGVIACETAICNLEGREGEGGLEYRGYRIEDLAGAVSYEETAYLLLHGDLPNRADLAAFNDRLRAARHLPEPLVALFRQVPNSVHPMDMLRTSLIRAAVSSIGSRLGARQPSSFVVWTYLWMSTARCVT